VGVAVQTGEGTTDIIYGSTSIPAGPRTYGGYLARPDGIGEWPTILVYGPTQAPTSTIKNICRVFARHGIAALAPEMTDDRHRNRRISASIAGFIANPTGDWSNAEYGYGVLAFEAGIADAASLAMDDGLAIAFASVGSTLDDEVTSALEDAAVPGIVIASRADEAFDVEMSLAARDRLTDTTFVMYADGDTGFWNDDAPGFREDRYRDTVDRLVAFFDDQLPPRV
jgi:dienelactone hydrolase